MEICRKLAGYSYGHADIVRRAMAKKKHDIMLKERESFISGAEKNGISRQTANEIFEEMISFASYAFNKSHACAYACIAYQTAYLKYHYRGIYMSALMSSVAGNTDKLSEYINMCCSYGIEVVRPDINKSVKKFLYSNGKMYFGLMAIKNVGEGLAERIVHERTQRGLFNSLQDFAERMDKRDLVKKAVESLIMSGAFDEMGLNRRQMLENYSTILEKTDKTGVIEGQLNFLDDMDIQEMNIKIPFIPEYPKRKLLSMEKEVSGIYLTGNPLSEYDYLPELLRTSEIKSILGANDDIDVKILCMIQNIKSHITKKGDKMCFLELSDGTGNINAIVFPELFSKVSGNLKEGNIIFVNGRMSVKDDDISLICTSMTDETFFTQMISQMKLCLKITSAELPNNYMPEICKKFSGNTKVVFYLTDVKKMLSPRNRLSVNICMESVAEIRKKYPISSVGLIS